ncbi:hypothetical protein BBO_00737 [Beauveria brongniartii RCEF 3172]|uniref:Uncharacterized protein n=1 Tax=Beauveria brongniartii RCEF 3172 TaxID=1081107 RepID=A0A162M4X1_9HYPO|nr:hypothetical protein BBO_00737 [Beauveria brongniartii RCEF 3172]
MLTAGTITLRIKQEVDDEGLTHLTIDSKSGTGLPGSTERRLFNNETRQGNHPLFGKITGRTRCAALDDLPSDWLATGWEDDTSRVILMATEHLDIGAVTYKAGALELIDGDRRYVRHVEVQKGEEQLKTKIIYDYLGPLDH